jgi:hypothetical protein
MIHQCEDTMENEHVIGRVIRRIIRVRCILIDHKSDHELNF